MPHDCRHEQQAHRTPDALKTPMGLVQREDLLPRLVPSHESLHQVAVAASADRTPWC